MSDGDGNPTLPLASVQLTEFTLVIPLARLNSMIECMSLGPYKIVQDHIAFIQDQTQRQVAAAQAKPNGASPAG